MAAARLVTQAFWANSALFQLCLLAYNLLVRVLWLTMKHKLREEPETVRTWLIRVPAKLVTHAGQLIVNASATWLFQERWQMVERGLPDVQFA